ncbi:MAG TPA: hypothetical protein VKB69_07885 [Micromonosporaceae bacterium]|nr:hypothetical protein [Micromonosporaceae bacterium]
MKAANRLLCPLVAGLLALSGCTGQVPAGAVPAVPTPAPATSAAATAGSTCDPRMGTCLGPVAAGTYTSTSFNPPITYTVPAGWENFQDSLTDFMLDRTSDPVDDFFGQNAIYIHRNVSAAAQDCGSSAEPGVGRSVEQLAAWLGGLDGLTVTPAKPATMGGLDGLTLDIRLAKGWRKTCDWANDRPIVPLTISGDPAQFRHTGHFTAQGGTWRFYLLATPDGGNVAVQLLDIPRGVSFDGYMKAVAPVLASLRFGGG